MKHVNAVPEPPSARMGKPVSPALEAFLLRCLAKKPSDRASNAGELLLDLDKCVVEGKWTALDAAAWWADNEKVSQGKTTMPANLEATQMSEKAVPETTIAYQKQMDV